MTMIELPALQVNPEIECDIKIYKLAGRTERELMVSVMAT